MLKLEFVLIQATIFSPVSLKQGSGKFFPAICRNGAGGPRVDLLEEGSGSWGCERWEGPGKR